MQNFEKSRGSQYKYIGQMPPLATKTVHIFLAAAVVARNHI